MHVSKTASGCPELHPRFARSGNGNDLETVQVTAIAMVYQPHGSGCFGGCAIILSSILHGDFASFYVPFYHLCGITELDLSKLWLLESLSQAPPARRTSTFESNGERLKSLLSSYHWLSKLERSRDWILWPQSVELYLER